MSTYLILINNAPQMAPYHKAIGDKLKEKGHQVIYAFTDILPIVTHDINLENETYYVFSNYFRLNQTNPLHDKKYLDINIWKTYFSDYDRYTVHYNNKTYGSNYYEQLMTCLVNFFHEILTLHKVETIFYECISNSFPYVAFEVGLLNNVKYFGYVNTRLANRFEIHSEEFGIDEPFKKEFSSIDLNAIGSEEMAEIEKYLEKFNSDNIPLYQAKKSILSADYSLSKRYINNEKWLLLKGAWATYRKERRNGFQYMYQTGNPLKMYSNLFKRQIRRKVRTIFGNSYFEPADYNEKFFLFPLHMKPESSTSVMARHFCDDFALINNIAFNLPFGYKLYVKEHDSNYGNQTFDFYRRLKQIPNVKLINADENSTALLKKCEAVITITSTMGMEALLMKKKAVVFGNVFYQAHPNCFKLTGFDMLFTCLKEITKHEISPDIDAINRKFIAAYRKSTLQGNSAYIFYETYDPGRFTGLLIPHLLNTTT